MDLRERHAPTLPTRYFRFCFRQTPRPDCSHRRRRAATPTGLGGPRSGSTRCCSRRRRSTSLAQAGTDRRRPRPAGCGSRKRLSRHRAAMRMTSPPPAAAAAAEFDDAGGGWGTAGARTWGRLSSLVDVGRSVSPDLASAASDCPTAGRNTPNTTRCNTSGIFMLSVLPFNGCA